MSSHCSSSTSEFQLMSCELNIPSFVRSSFTGSPAHSYSGSLRRTQILQRRLLLCTFSIYIWSYPFNQLLQKSFVLSEECTLCQLLHSHMFLQMESVLLSTGLPYASDYVSHLDKITHDDHCKYGNSSMAMEI